MTPPVRWNETLIFVVCLLLLALAMVMNRFLGSDVSVLLFYVLPIFIAARCFNVGGVVVCGLVGAVFQVYDAYHPTHMSYYWWVPLWNAGMRMGTVVVLGYYIITRELALQEQKELLEVANRAFDKAWDIGGLFPMCPSCKQIRTDAAYVAKLQSYIDQPDARRFIHLTCPHCAAVCEAERVKLG